MEFKTTWAKSMKNQRSCGAEISLRLEQMENTSFQGSAWSLRKAEDDVLSLMLHWTCAQHCPAMDK